MRSLENTLKAEIYGIDVKTEIYMTDVETYYSNNGKGYMQRATAWYLLCASHSEGCCFQLK